MIDICSDLFDTLTVIKGFMELNNENKKRKIDYSLILVQEIKDMEHLIRNLCDLINKEQSDVVVGEKNSNGKKSEVAFVGSDTLETSIPGETSMLGQAKPDTEF